jgi:hypothetical protein
MYNSAVLSTMLVAAAASPLLRLLAIKQMLTVAVTSCFDCLCCVFLSLCCYYSVLGILEAAAFHPFVINNRRHFYVYRNSQGAVFYMELVEVKASTVANSTTASSSADAQQQQQQQQRAPAALALEDSAKAVQLAVYGVEAAVCFLVYWRVTLSSRYATIQQHYAIPHRVTV